MKEGSSVMKALSLGAIALFFLFLGREAPMDLIDGFLSDNVQEEEFSETVIPDEVLVVGNNEFYPVEEVIDGDTLRVTIDGVSESVRILGINAPETEFSDRGAECFGAQASEYARTLLEGTEVELTSDDSQDIRDKYDRLLAYVTLPDGRDFGEVMIRDGYAYQFTFKGVPYENQQLYKDAEAQAQEYGVGLWRDERCQR